MIYIIVAADLNNAIGRNNSLPWKQKDDLKFFKAITDGETVIVGRKTYESMPKLNNRIVIVVTRDKDYPSEYKATSLEEAITLAKQFNKYIFIIGGSQIYFEAMKFASKIFLTRIHTEVESPDSFFPVIDENFELSVEIKCSKDNDNEFDYTFQTYIRK